MMPEKKHYSYTNLEDTPKVSQQQYEPTAVRLLIYC